MSDGFTFHVMRDEWVAQIGHEDDVGSPMSFNPYWTSDPFPTRAQAVEALEAHKECLGYNERFMRYKMANGYTRGHVIFRQTEVDQFDK